MFPLHLRLQLSPLQPNPLLQLIQLTPPTHQRARNRGERRERNIRQSPSHPHPQMSHRLQQIQSNGDPRHCATGWCSYNSLLPPPLLPLIPLRCAISWVPSSWPLPPLSVRVPPRPRDYPPPNRQLPLLAPRVFGSLSVWRPPSPTPPARALN